MSFQNLILRNFWLKAFSVVLATVIWFFIHDGIRHDAALSQLTLEQPLPHEYIRVPVTIQTAPGDTRVFRLTPKEVVIIAEGEKASLERAAKQDFKVYLNLTDFHAKGTVTEALQADVPPSITMLEISPPVVQVQKISP